MTFEISLVLLVLAVTVILFIGEWLRVDVIAIFIMLILAWLKLVTPAQIFSGFAGNAVISMIAVMILGYGIDSTGVMERLTGPIIKTAGTNPSRLTLFVSAAVDLISAFMQNIGATALFLPALLRISRNTSIPTSRLFMPMGFAAILGGTLTQLSQIRDKNRAGDSASGVSFHHKWHQEVRPKRTYISSAAAVSVNPTSAHQVLSYAHPPAGCNDASQEPAHP
ncbi:MAG: hypothetical protein JW787_07875 [Sedimentisphaerales bacterium]|nr:hypothetical protein [Sedimentisphaerales bacterium]